MFLQAHRPALLIIIFLAGCAQQAPVPPLDLTEALPDVSARFSTERHFAAIEHNHGHADEAEAQPATNITHEWILWRHPQRIEIDIPAQQTGERWIRDGHTLFYQKLFHADHKIVEYMSDDLAALEINVNWRTNELMLDPAVLQQLTVEDETWIDGHPALELAGTIADIEYEVTWLVDMNLPYSLNKLDLQGNREQTRLLKFEPITDATVPPPDSSQYETIDYADLGDRERDPFVQKIQHQLPGGHHH